MIRFATICVLLFCAPISIASEPINFDLQVLPTLTRLGCNAGSCHGAAVGRGGFHLSLWGSNPQEDYLTITRQFESRRIDLANPAKSLFLKKPTAIIDHEGGALIDEGSPEWQILHTWIEQGAQRANAKQLTQLQIQIGDSIVTNDVAATIPLLQNAEQKITAQFADQSQQNIEPFVAVSISDSSSLKFDSQMRRLTPLRSGIHTIVVRYANIVQAIQVLTPDSSKQANDPKPVKTSAENLIDFWLDQRRSQLGHTASPLADEPTILRRVMLDLIGRAPTPEELQRYSQDDNHEKYQQLVEQLLASPQFIDFWTYRWTRYLGLRPNNNAPQGLLAFHRWMHLQIGNNRPWDQVIQELVTASGDSHQISPAFFMLLANDARQQAEQISRLFIGARMECANCHDHPLDRWKQDDYHGLAAVFARLDRKQVVRWSDRGGVTHPRTGLPAVAQLPGGPRFNSSGDVRAELAKWMLDAKAPVAARATVNRLWSHFFGRGLVEPIDDLRLTNPATHPQLLNELTDSLLRQQYDLKQLMRMMVLSEAYRRQAPSSAEKSLGDVTYDDGPRKSLTAEVLLDLINDATGNKNIDRLKSDDGRAIQIADPTTPSPTLDTLGRCVRSDACAAPTANSSLALMLHWINGETINDRIMQPDHWLQQSLSADQPFSEIIDEMYLRTLCRRPLVADRQNHVARLTDLPVTERLAYLEDLQWALLSSRDFLDNR